MLIAGYAEGRMLKNVTSRLLSRAVQDSMPDVGLVPTYQNCSVGGCQKCATCTSSSAVFEQTCMPNTDLLGTHQESSFNASY